MNTINPKEIKTHPTFSELFPINSVLLKRIEQDMRDKIYDFSQPIVLAVWDGQEEPVCIDGHTRLQAALNVGLESVAVWLREDFETEEEALEHAIKAAEDDEWRRTDPEARKRASDTVEMFTTQIEKLAKQADDAEARGDLKKAQKTRESIKTYTEWLNQATKALDEFSGNGA